MDIHMGLTNVTLSKEVSHNVSIQTQKSKILESILLGNINGKSTSKTQVIERLIASSTKASGFIWGGENF
jgi:hypothetical protein